MLALGRLVDISIVKPAPAMADDLAALASYCLGGRRVALRQCIAVGQSRGRMMPFSSFYFRRPNFGVDDSTAMVAGSMVCFCRDKYLEIIASAFE